MDRTVTGIFDSIDLATIAASNAKSHCGGVREVKVKYKPIREERDDRFLFPAMLAAGDINNSNLGMQNGVYPLPIPINEFVNGSPYPPHSKEAKKATVKITADEKSVSNICATLRQGGGNKVKVV